MRFSSGAGRVACNLLRPQLINKNHG